MAAYNQFNDLTNQLARATHNFATHVFKVMLTNTAPVATNTVRADIIEVGAAGGYPAGGLTLDGVVLTQSGKQASISWTDEVFTATGAAVGPFRYAVIYNDTPTTPADPLVGWYDYGSSITLADSEPITLDFTGAAITIGTP